MGTSTLEERYAANLHGVLSCFDRIIKQVELHVLGLVPELEHDGIVPTDTYGEK